MFTSLRRLWCAYVEARRLGFARLDSFFAARSRLYGIRIRAPYAVWSNGMPSGRLWTLRIGESQYATCELLPWIASHKFTVLVKAEEHVMAVETFADETLALECAEGIRQRLLNHGGTPVD